MVHRPDGLHIGTWMQVIAQGYLLYTLTGSVAYLGYVGFVSGLPSWLLVIYGGVYFRSSNRNG